MLTKAEISLIRSLSDRKSRQQHGIFVAEGRKTTGEIASSGLKAVRILSSGGYPGAEPVTAKEMERISHLKTPSDTLALVEIPSGELPPSPGENELVLMLDDVQDPGNMGTIIRLAEWFGIKDIICSSASADCFAPKAVQASMGAVLRVRVHYAPLEGVLSAARSGGTPVYGTFLEGEDIYGAELSPRGMILMGNEGKGISAGAAKYVSRRLLIPSFADTPGPGKPESLNVAVAAAIVCSEFRRRRY